MNWLRRLPVRSLLGLLVTLVAGAAPAAAQLSPLPVRTLGTIGQLKSAIRGNDAAYDADLNRYLVVGACYGAACGGGFGNVYGFFADVQGTLLAGPFTIEGGSANAHFPRVEFSPHVNSGAGGFVVVWVEEGNGVHTKVLSRDGAPTSGDNIISSGSAQNPYFGETGAAIAYSQSSQRFLVTWSTFPGYNAMARLVGLNGAGIGSPVLISGSLEYAYYTGVAWNPHTNEFGVSFAVEHGSTSRAGFARVSATSGAPTGLTTFSNFTGLPGGTEIEYNIWTQRFVMAGWQNIQVRIWEIDGAGTVLTSGLGLTPANAYNAVGLALNPNSGTFLLTNLTSTDGKRAVELNIRGFPQSAVLTIGTGRYTRATANTEQKTWNVTGSSDDHLALHNQIVATTSSSGGSSTAHPAYGSGGSGGGGTPPPPPPPPTSSCTSTKPASDWVCVNGNWLPPGMLPAPPPPPPGTPPPPPPPPTSSCRTAKPASNWVCVNGNWLPPGMLPAPPPPPPGGCTTAKPGTGWVCVNGNWLPPTTTSSCTTTKPASNWVCVNGDWLPPSLAGGGGSTGGLPICTSLAGSPGSGWVRTSSGGWLPPGHSLIPTQGVCRAP